MSKGRKSKPGKRTKSGRLQRDHKAPTLAERNAAPSEWVGAMKARYGVHYCWAMGRAYAAGHLGDEVEAYDRYMAAKRFVRLYRRFIGGSAYACPLGVSVRGLDPVHMDVTEQQERDHQWLFAAMDSMDVAGVRPYFDQLITNLHTDHGPPWLDRMLAGGRDPCDKVVLDAVIRGLDILAPERSRPGIVAIRA